MALPIGYTKLEYIQSSGPQYIDTGYKPNNNTRVVMDCNLLGGNIPTPFGTWTSSSAATYIVLLDKNTQTRYYYGTTYTAASSNISGRHVLDANKNVLYMDGKAIVTRSTATFSCAVSLFLCGRNNGAGTLSNATQMRIYSCRIYDNGTLVRDFVPCKNASGVIGLYDLVDGKFYANAGTGVFTAGPEIKGTHKALIDGTEKTITGGNVMVAGTVVPIKKGRVLIDGTGYDISFAEEIEKIEQRVEVSDDVSSTYAYATILGEKIAKTGTYIYETDGVLQISVYVGGSTYGASNCRIKLNSDIVQQGAGTHTFDTAAKTVHISFVKSSYQADMNGSPTTITTYVANITTED